VLAASTLILIYNIWTSLKRGKKAGEPVGCAHARVDDQFAAAVLQLQEDSGRAEAPYDFGEPLPYLGIDPQVDEFGNPPAGQSARPAHV
jgi:hypothetical protein